MPQLVKGGKYVFGWSPVGPGGIIRIPDEAATDYRLNPLDRIIVISGSRTHKGFAISKRELLKGSPLYLRIQSIPDLWKSPVLKGGTVIYKNRIYTHSVIDERGGFSLSWEALNQYSVSEGDHLLVCRGSGLALSFIREGPIVQEAITHSDLKVYR
jgi:hypothetical protein